MKTLNFTVTITFNDHIKGKKQIAEITENIRCGLQYQADTAGLAPEFAETFTTDINVNHVKVIKNKKPDKQAQRVHNAGQYICDDDEYSIEDMIALAEAHPNPNDLLSYVDGVTVWEPLENSLSVKQFLESI